MREFVKAYSGRTAADPCKCDHDAPTEESKNSLERHSHKECLSDPRGVISAEPLTRRSAIT